MTNDERNRGAPPDAELEFGAPAQGCFLALLGASPGGFQLLARQPLVGLDVFVACVGDDMVREPRGGGRFVPIQRLEVISEELFVEAGLAAAGLVLSGRPEPGRVGCQQLVYEDQAPFAKTELEFCVGNDDSALAGELAGGLVDFQAELTDLFGLVRADHRRGLLAGDVVVVDGFGVCGWWTVRLRRFRSFSQSAGQANAA